jgi:predicted amidohydrolase YtcJ
LIGEQRRRGALAPGLLADLVAFTADPLSCPLGDLPQLQVAFTMVAGRAVYDPHELFDTGQE